jgi:hypothetical protein
MLYFVYYFHIPFAFRSHSEWQTLFTLNKFVYM